MSRKCLTPGAVFHTHTSPTGVSVKVDIPGQLDLSLKEAEELENELHDAVEAVLARRWHLLNITERVYDRPGLDGKGGKGSKPYIGPYGDGVDQNDR